MALTTISGNSSLAVYMARNEQKLNDLSGRAEHLQALNWYDFQLSHPTGTVKRWSSMSALLGASFGMIGGLLGSSLIVASAPEMLSSSMIVLGIPVGGGIGATIGREYPMEVDKRAYQIEAYERYLNAFEKQDDSNTQTATPSQAVSVPKLTPSLRAARTEIAQR